LRAGPQVPKIPRMMISDGFGSRLHIERMRLGAAQPVITPAQGQDAVDLGADE